MSKLADHLAQAGKRPSHLAHELGVMPSTISRIISGERRPSPELAKKISELTGLTVTDLLFPCEGEAA